jgi:RNA polymerase sporulation-specific sigma factor
MIIAAIISFLKGMIFFTGSYSHNAFPEPLSKEDETKYIDLYIKGDVDAKNKLIEHNLRLVAHIVKKYEIKQNDTDDLISIGTIGLIKGVNTFKFKHGTKLTTYCARCIENAIIT